MAISPIVAEVTARVAEQKTVAASLREFVRNLKTKYDEAVAANNPAALAELSTALGELVLNTQTLSDTMLENTPQDPANPQARARP